MKSVSIPACPIADKPSKLFSALHIPGNQLDDIHDALDDIIWAASFDPFQCLYVNKACEKIFGFSAAEMMADNTIFQKCIYPEDVEQFYASVTIAYETGKSNCIFRVINKEGKIKVLRAQAILKKSEDGGTPVLTGIASDITALLNIRNQLKEKATELETILESINDAFFTIDHKANITYINTAFENLLGISRNEVTGRNAWELFPATLDTQFYRSFSECLANKTIARFEDYYAPLEKWFSVNIYPTKAGLSVYCTDMTEEHVAKAQLNAAKQNLRAIIDNTSDLIWSVDRDYNIIESNQNYRRLVADRYASVAMEGRHVFENVPGDKQAEWGAFFERGFKGEPYEILHEMNVDGKTYYSSVRFNPILDNNGQVVGVSCFSTDVTKQHLQSVEIEAKNQILTEIARMQSHQVRGPVATILGLAQLIEMTEGPHDPHNADILQGIVDAAKNLDVAIQEIDKKSTNRVTPASA